MADHLAFEKAGESAPLKGLLMGPRLENKSAIVTAEVWVLLTAPLSAHASASMKEPQRALNSVCRRNNRTRLNHKKSRS